MPNTNDGFEQDHEPELQQQPIVDLVAENERLMLEGLNQMPETYIKAVMIIGSTGFGKSTLINLLAGKQLLAQRHGRTLILDSPDTIPGIRIGHNVLSETSVPHSWRRDDSTIYWDCPGLGDNRGKKHEIANAFLIKKLFDVYRTCKILIVVSDASLSLDAPRYTSFLDLVKRLDRVFRSDIESIKSGLMIAVSKADQDQTEINIREIFEEICANAELDVSVSQRAIILALAENPIIIFKKPVEEGVFAYNNEEYLDKIENQLGVINHINNIQVRSLISPESNLVITELYNNLSQAINSYIHGLMSNLSLRLQNVIETPNEQQLNIALAGFRALSIRVGNNEVVLSNQQLLSEIVPECARLEINRDIGAQVLNLISTLNLTTTKQKTEMFEFLEQFVERDAKVKLGIREAITGYLSSCTRDATAAIQAIKLEQETAKTTVLQAEVGTLKTEVQNLRNRSPGRTRILGVKW